MVRYEDFSSDPVNNTRKIFDFLGFNFSQQVSQFLESHTQTARPGTLTFRDTKTAPFKWTEKLNKTEVLKIQVWRHSKNVHSLYSNCIIRPEGKM